MISLTQNMWSWTRVQFPLRHLTKEQLQLTRKVTFFYEINKRTVRLFYSRLQLSEEAFCKILSNCRSERDVETGKIGQNQDITSDWREDRLYRSDSNLEQKEISEAPSTHGRFPLDVRNLSWTFGFKFVISPDNPGHFNILMIFIAWFQETQDWFLETRIYQVIKARDNSALQVKTIKNVVT